MSESTIPCKCSQLLLKVNRGLKYSTHHSQVVYLAPAHFLMPPSPSPSPAATTVPSFDTVASTPCWKQQVIMRTSGIIKTIM